MTPVLFVGDIHGDFNLLLWKLYHKKVRDCVLISVGDIGVGFPTKRLDVDSLAKKFAKMRIRFMGIRGNHDNPAFFDGSVANEYFSLLPDYTAFVLNDLRFLLVGGAISIDRVNRESGVWWWPDEKFVLKGAEPCDVLVTHSTPPWSGPIVKFGVQQFLEKDVGLWGECMKERNDIGELVNSVKPRWHFAGHFHETLSTQFNGCTSRILNINEVMKPYLCELIKK